MALTVVTVHGTVLQPVTNVPAVGTVSFNTLIELRDTVDNIVYAPMTFTATLDVNGEFTVVVPATDNPDLTPVNWVYQVWIDTDILNAVQYFQIPFQVGTVEFADLVPLDFDPCTDQIPTATPIAPSDYDLFVRRAGDTMTGNLVINANLNVSGTTGLAGNVNIGGQLGVVGLAAFSSDVAFNDSVSISDDLTVNDDVLVGGDLGVTGTLTTGALNITGDLLVGDDLTVTDDTQMTGDLNVDGVSTVTFTSTSLNVGQLLAMSQSTSVLFGGEITPNGVNPRIDIAPMTGYIVTYNSSAAASPTNPSIQVINYPGAVGILPAFSVFTHFYVDSTGTLIQQATEPTSTTRRQMIYLGATAIQGGVLLEDQTLPIIPSQLNNQFADLLTGLTAFNTGGNVLSANGVNLNINKTAGNVFARAFGQIPTNLNPHNSPLAAQTPITFRLITRVAGSAGLPVTALNVGFYDNGGVITPVGGGANTSTNFRVWGFPVNNVANQILIQYGQNTYASLAAAVQGLGSGTYVPNPATVNAALLGWISVTRTAVDLSNPAQATFTTASKFATP